MNLILSQSQSLQILTKVQIKQAQSLKLALRTDLIQTLRGEKYKPKATCPKCGYKLTAADILKGFTNNPDDITTKCPECKIRFRAELVCYYQGSRVITPFYCAVQTLAMLNGKEKLLPQQMLKKEVGIYRSAIFHFGGLKQAFEKINIDYPHKEIHTWQNKVMSFLGKLPDAVIARCCDISTNKIRYLRKKQGIPPCTNQKIYEEEIM